VTRARARAQALEVLYEADSRSEPVGAAAGRRGDLDPYARDLVDGVAAHQAEIDGIIAGHSHRWELGHMPVIDRNALRLGLFELLWGDVPPAVAMDQAIELCKKYSTTEAARFVNGVLAAVAHERRLSGSAP